VTSLTAAAAAAACSFRDFNLPGRTDYNWCTPASEDDIRKSVTPPGGALQLLQPAHEYVLLHDWHWQV
jgi:hypothetical protein